MVILRPLGFLTILACNSATDSPGPSSGSLAVLSYNVHGLPPTITGDDTDGRIAQIAPLLVGYDLIGLQEVWDADNANTLISAANLETVENFDDALSDRVYGAGLVGLANVAELDLLEQHYEGCVGVVDHASDCLASKGFQVLRLELSDGAELDFYNTHLEAGSGDEDNVVRAAQVDDLIAAMNGWSADRAILFVGDTNLSGDDPIDTPEIDRWMAATGLSNVCDLLDCPEPERIDRVLIRSGSGLTLTAEDWRVEPQYVDMAGTPLSDHDPIYAKLGWSRE